MFLVLFLCVCGLWYKGDCCEGRYNLESLCFVDFIYFFCKELIDMFFIYFINFFSIELLMRFVMNVKIIIRC